MSTTLLLNTDAQPVSFLPLSTLSWEDAIKYMVLEKAHVLSWYDSWIVHSATWETRVPAVMMLHDRQKVKSSVRFSKGNLFLRDHWCCQYCGCGVDRKNATVDHVLPTSHGGKTTFENCVTACAPCNANKGNNKKIVPRVKPTRPNYWNLVAARRAQGWTGIPEQWQDYLV
jgi:5-methylcytosine-specific restriction endonuclease McrA